MKLAVFATLAAGAAAFAPTTQVSVSFTRSYAHCALSLNAIVY